MNLQIFFQAYLENLLCYGFDAKETHLKTALWIPDDSGEEQYYKKTQGGGYAKREVLVNKSSIIPFSCQVHCDFWNNKRFLVSRLNFVPE